MVRVPGENERWTARIVGNEELAEQLAATATRRLSTPVIYTACDSHIFAIPFLFLLIYGQLNFCSSLSFLSTYLVHYVYELYLIRF